MFCMFFILDRMNSVGISEFNTILDVFILVWNRRGNDPIQKNVSVLIFRLVWKSQKMKPEIGNDVTRENY